MEIKTKTINNKVMFIIVIHFSEIMIRPISIENIILRQMKEILWGLKRKGVVEIQKKNIQEIYLSSQP